MAVTKSDKLVDKMLLKQMIDDYGDAVATGRGQAMTRAINLLEAWAVQLAPVDTGNLEASTQTQVRAEGLKKLVGELRFVTPYAATVHEKGSPGPLTQKKSGNKYGPAGPKYLERPLVAMRKEFPKILAATVKEQLG